MADYRVTWDKKKENELIDFFEAHSCLWDHSHADYFRRDVRDGLMKELSCKLGCDRSGRPYTEIHIKMRWKNIRTTYARECRKGESHSEDGSEYISKWAFIDRLGFIKDFIKARAPYNYSNNTRLSATTAVDQTEVYQTLSDEDIDEDDDDDLVVCLSETFKDDNATQKSNQDMWDTDDKKSIWISESVSLVNNQCDLKNMDNSKNMTETWVIQEKTSPQRDWRIEERNHSPSEIWRKDNKVAHQTEVCQIDLHETDCDPVNDIQVSNVAYVHNLKTGQSEKSHSIEDYQQSEVISMVEPLNMNGKVSWSKDKESELIEYFETHRFLWDHSHPDYFNRDLRDCMIRELSAKLGRDRNGQPYTEMYIRQRWKNLRTTFARELKKIEYHSKHNHEAPYISRWAHTERLTFLKDCLKARGHTKIISQLQNNVDTCQTYSLSDDSNVDNDSVTWSNEPFVEEPASTFEQLSRTKRADSNTAIGSLEPHVDGNYNGSTPYLSMAKKRCRSNDIDSKDDFFKEALNILNLNLKERHDPEDLFGMHVAGTLRRMQPLQREKAKLDIQGILLQHCFSKLEMSSGTGFGCSVKGFRRLTNTMYGTVGTGLTMTSRGFRPGFTSMLVSQFGNIQGRLVWTAGMTTAMSTIIVYDSIRRHAVFTVQIGIPNSFVSLSYTHKFQDDDARLRGAIRVGVFSTILECGIEKKITEYSTLGATMLVGVPTGVTLRIKLSRGRQTFLFPIHLSDHVMPSAIFYGTAVPFMLYHAVRVLVIQPYLQEQKKRDIEKKQEEHSEMIHKKKMEAEAAIHLMQETVQRIIEQESEKAGLLILRALYGKLADKSEDGFVDGKYIDVAVPLQCLIKNSSLLIPEKNSKTGLLGFYDPCLGEEKSLYIRYKFRNKLHHVTQADCEPLKIPLKKHIIKDNETNGSHGKS